MRNFLIIAVCVCVLAMFSGCQTVAAPAMGTLYLDVKAPMGATAHSGYSKVGKAQIQSILGLIATGDASIEAAAKSANITKIHHVDYESHSILGIISTFTTVVYGD
jgi:hypothetical protein